MGTTREAPTSSGPSPRRFTVEEYYRMASAGILRADERVELIEGEILLMSPIGRRHIASVIWFNRLFAQRLLAFAEISVQNPLRLGPTSEPEPDIVLLRLRQGERRPYESSYPGPDDVLLVVEVAETSVAYDLGEKAGLYARAGIAEYWVHDLAGSRLVVHRDPAPDGYASVAELRRGDTVSPLAFPDVAFAVDEILG